jgi:hypothetical protein
MRSVAEKSVPRKIAESVVVVAAAVGLMAFGTFGAFEDEHTAFPPPSADDAH